MPMNWTIILTEEARRNCILRSDELAHRNKFSEAVARNALIRYQALGLVERVSTKIYVNQLNQQFSPRDLVNVLRPESYISLESATGNKAMTSQTHSVRTCVTHRN